MTDRKDFDALGVIETPLVQTIEQAIADSATFCTLIDQSGNEPAACARDIAQL